MNTYSNQIGALDKVFCRWVLMFSGKVEEIVAEVYERLKPGGKFISIEYFNFRQIDMFPESEIFNHLFAKVWELLKMGGGDPDIGGKLYQIMEAKGFQQVEGS